MNCPYDDCPFQGTQDQVDDHVLYLIGVGDPEHDEQHLYGGRRG